MEGQGWDDTETPYDRLPARAKGVVRDPVWELSQHSAGLCVRFATDTATIAARWKLRFENLAMDHMPATGVSGLDLYALDSGRWRWAAVGRPAEFPDTEATLITDIPRQRRQFLLYLPLYNGVEQVAIGISEDAELLRVAPSADAPSRPVCFYGTSITQGGCASRCGMAYPAILGRRLQRPSINLGFSGNGLAEPEMARFMAELGPAAYVLDPLPNMDAAAVAERIEPFVCILREQRPRTPIVLVGNISYENGWLVPGRRERESASNAALEAAYGRLVDAGVPGLHHMPGHLLFGPDALATVDGTHATDVGFLHIADALEPVLRTVL